MLRKLLISLMTIGLLAGCMQDKEEPKDDKQPMDEEIQEGIDNMEEETDQMFDEGNMDPNKTDAPEESEGGNNEEPTKPEDAEE